jgi:hypothetical protein
MYIPDFLAYKLENLLRMSVNSSSGCDQTRVRLLISTSFSVCVWDGRSISEKYLILMIYWHLLVVCLMVTDVFELRQSHNKYLAFLGLGTAYLAAKSNFIDSQSYWARGCAFLNLAYAYYLAGLTIVESQISWANVLASLLGFPESLFTDLLVSSSIVTRQSQNLNSETGTYRNDFLVRRPELGPGARLMS